MAEPSQTITAALANARAQLAGAGIESARLDAEVLLRHVLGIDRTALFQHLRDPLRSDQLDQFTTLIERRTDRVPVAYLTGQKEFMGLLFEVAPDVLIPRPETELLVEWALSWLNQRTQTATIVIDVGTGSGAIALSLAVHLAATRRVRIVGADVSPAALRIAAHNQYQLGLDGAVALVRGDLLAWCGAADLVLANLPYLRPEQITTNPDLAAEPSLALLGGADGLALIRRLVADAPRVLRPGGAVALEIDPSQAATVARLLESALPGVEVEVHPDLAGLARVVTVMTR